MVQSVQIQDLIGDRWVRLTENSLLLPDRLQPLAEQRSILGHRNRSPRDNRRGHSQVPCQCSRVDRIYRSSTDAVAYLVREDDGLAQRTTISDDPSVFFYAHE